MKRRIPRSKDHDFTGWLRKRLRKNSPLTVTFPDVTLRHKFWGVRTDADVEAARQRARDRRLGKFKADPAKVREHIKDVPPGTKVESIVEEIVAEFGVSPRTAFRYRKKFH